MEFWTQEETNKYGPVEYNYINFSLMAFSGIVISAGIIGIIFLIIRDYRKKIPVYEPNIGLPYHKPPPKRRLSFIYEKYFLDLKIKPMEKLKLPKITESVFTTRDKFDKEKSPRRT